MSSQKKVAVSAPGNSATWCNGCNGRICHNQSTLTHGHSCKRNQNHCEDVVTGASGLLPGTCGKHPSFSFQRKFLPMFGCSLT